MNKITIIHHYGNISGAGVSLLQTVNLLKNNYEVEVCCPANTDMATLLINNNVKVIPYEFNLGSIQYFSGGPRIISRTFGNCIINIFRTKKKWINIIKEFDSDIIIINSIIICWLAKIIKRYTNKKVICFIRETFPKNGNIFVFSYFKNIFLKYCDKVCFISGYDKKIFLNNDDKGIVIRNSIPDSFFNGISKEDACEKINIIEDTFNILFVGGMSKLKGTEIIVKAMNGLPQDILLIVAGYSGNEIDLYSQRVYKYIENHNLNQNIKFIGIQKDMATVYSCCDVLVFPSTKAHQARPIFEAGALKKTVIAANFTEINESVKNYENGLLFSCGDEEDLRKKILYLYNNRDECVRLGQENYVYTKKFHTMENAKKVLLETVKDLLHYS